MQYYYVVAHGAKHRPINIFRKFGVQTNFAINNKPLRLSTKDQSKARSTLSKEIKQHILVSTHQVPLSVSDTTRRVGSNVLEKVEEGARCLTMQRPEGNRDYHVDLVHGQDGKRHGRGRYEDKEIRGKDEFLERRKREMERKRKTKVDPESARFLRGNKKYCYSKSRRCRAYC
ncbi:LOW QUALITY PROTEIN: hypothetical protein V1477_012022 [Vespula maculifrons]|uniref:Uncharacterized protein n=1 Tax=Vespula maculifrons TaxID=7453 RepID=A0ABD2C2M1_VESMC